MTSGTAGGRRPGKPRADLREPSAFVMTPSRGTPHSGRPCPGPAPPQCRCSRPLRAGTLPRTGTRCPRSRRRPPRGNRAGPRRRWRRWSLGGAHRSRKRLGAIGPPDCGQSARRDDGESPAPGEHVGRARRSDYGAVGTGGQSGRGAAGEGSVRAHCEPRQAWHGDDQGHVVAVGQQLGRRGEPVKLAVGPGDVDGRVAVDRAGKDQGARAGQLGRGGSSANRRTEHCGVVDPLHSRQDARR